MSGVVIATVGAELSGLSLERGLLPHFQECNSKARALWTNSLSIVSDPCMCDGSNIVDIVRKLTILI